MAQLGNFLLSRFSYFFLYKKFCLFIPKSDTGSKSWILPSLRVTLGGYRIRTWEHCSFILALLVHFVPFLFVTERNMLHSVSLCCVPFRCGLIHCCSFCSVPFNSVAFAFVPLRFVSFNWVPFRSSYIFILNFLFFPFLHSQPNTFPFSQLSLSLFVLIF